MLETIERMGEVITVPLAAQPNAGKPRDIEGRNLYLCSPDYMASYARRFVSLGVRLVGGCCGTTPEHIRQIQLALKAMAINGVYLGGGIAPKLLPKLKDGTFMKGFTNKGRYKRLMTQIPVHVVMNQHTGLLGAAATAARLAQP